MTAALVMLEELRPDLLRRRFDVALGEYLAALDRGERPPRRFCPSGHTWAAVRLPRIGGGLIQGSGSSTCPLCGEKGTDSDAISTAQWLARMPEVPDVPRFAEAEAPRQRAPYRRLIRSQVKRLPWKAVVVDLDEQGGAMPPSEADWDWDESEPPPRAPEALLQLALPPLEIRDGLFRCVRLSCTLRPEVCLDRQASMSGRRQRFAACSPSCPQGQQVRAALPDYVAKGTENVANRSTLSVAERQRLSKERLAERQGSKPTVPPPAPTPEPSETVTKVAEILRKQTEAGDLQAIKFLVERNVLGPTKTEQTQAASRPRRRRPPKPAHRLRPSRLTSSELERCAAELWRRELNAARTEARALVLDELRRVFARVLRARRRR